MSADFVKLEGWALLFVGGTALGHKPAACGGCTIFLQRQKRCAILGSSIIIDQVEKGGKTYTPICSQQDPGKPIDLPDDKVFYVSNELGSVKADDIGLEWAEGLGTNCGGSNGGAICSRHYTPTVPGKGFCAPLQTTVDADDCCAAHEGPSMPWREAQLLLREKEL